MNAIDKNTVAIKYKEDTGNSAGGNELLTARVRYNKLRGEYEIVVEDGDQKLLDEVKMSGYISMPDEDYVTWLEEQVLAKLNP